MKEKFDELENRVRLLQRIPVFSMLEISGLKALAALLTERKTRAQELLFKKGDKGKSMYILAEGEVRVHDANHVIARLQAGEVFGEYALIDTENRSASVTTEQVSRLLVLDRDALMPFLSQYPEILLSMLQLQIRRMRDMNELEEKLSKSYLSISKQKQEIEAQHEAIKAQKNLLETQNKDLNALNDQKKHLLSVIIHGLKNPMTSVQTMAELLNESSYMEKQEREYLEILNKSLARMNQVINDLIQSNQEETTNAQRKLPLNISKTIKDAFALHLNDLNEKQISFYATDSNLIVMLHEAYFVQLLDRIAEWIIHEIKPKSKLELIIEPQKSVQVVFKFECDEKLRQRKSQINNPGSLFEIAPEQLDLFAFINHLSLRSGISFQINEKDYPSCVLLMKLNQPAE